MYSSFWNCMYWIENLWRSRTSFYHQVVQILYQRIIYLKFSLSASKDPFVLQTCTSISTSFSINKSYRFFCQHLSLTFPRNRSYIYMFMYIFSPSNYFAAILHCRICPISTIFPNFFFIAESLYFPIKLLIRLQHLSLSILSWSM